MTHRFFVAEHEGRMFFGNSRGEEFHFVALRDGGSARLLQGTMHRTIEDAERDAAREPGPFEGAFVAIEELREVTREEVEELGAQASSSPDTYREAFRRSFR